MLPGFHCLSLGIRRDAVRHGAVQAGLWLEKGLVSRTGSWRIGYGYTCM
jgi:hypothetical protein